MKFNKKVLCIIVLSIVVILLVLVLFLSLFSKEDDKKGEEVEVKEVTYLNSDNRLVLTVSEDFKKKDVSNYDLYITKNDKQIAGFFTYNLNEYEENSSKEILDKQISYFTNSRKDFNLFKKEQVIELDDKTITKVEYSGTNNDSSDCVYVFAVIDFKSDSNYVVYANEVILHSEYEKNITEMLNILKNAKLN